MSSHAYSGPRYVACTRTNTHTYLYTQGLCWPLRWTGDRTTHATQSVYLTTLTVTMVTSDFSLFQFSFPLPSIHTSSHNPICIPPRSISLISYFLVGSFFFKGDFFCFTSTQLTESHLITITLGFSLTEGILCRMHKPMGWTDSHGRKLGTRAKIVEKGMIGQEQMNWWLCGFMEDLVQHLNSSLGWFLCTEGPLWWTDRASKTRNNWGKELEKHPLKKNLLKYCFKVGLKQMSQLEKNTEKMENITSGNWEYLVWGCCWSLI